MTQNEKRRQKLKEKNNEMSKMSKINQKELRCDTGGGLKNVTYL